MKSAIPETGVPITPPAAGNGSDRQEASLHGEILLRLRALRKLTLLIVEQSSTRAMMTGGRMVLIRGGRIVLEGPAADLVRDDRLKQSYFGFGDH